MPFKIVRNDITQMAVDAIVNTANPQPIYASGTDRAVYEAAGADLLLAERKKIGAMTPGQAAITPGFALPSKYIIHTVGPIWQGGNDGEEETLATCYRSCLQLAKQHRLHSIAFPMISTGVYGFPKDKALQIALACVSEFLTENDMEIYLVVFDRRTVQLSEKLIADIESYIDDHYVEERKAAEYSYYSEERRRPLFDRRGNLNQTGSIQCDSCLEEDSDEALPSMSAPRPCMDEAISMSSVECMSKAAKPLSAKPRRSLKDILGHTDETFQQQLFRLIKERGLANKDVYNKANMDKRLFSKIKANVDYVPKKSTALALCIALELNMDQSRDLLARAGYSFSPCSKVDLVVQYFIEQEVYDMYTIEAALFAHDLPLLVNYG